MEIYDHVLRAMVHQSMMFSSDSARQIFAALEWRKLLGEKVSSLENRWSFLERKFVVDYILSINQGNVTEQTSVNVPASHSEVISLTYNFD